MAQIVLTNAKAYIGVYEGSARHRQLIDQYNTVLPRPMGYAVKYTDDWCDAFVTVIGDLSGAARFIGRECGVQRHIHVFQSLGIWLGRVRPKAGDLVTFDWDGRGFADHIGFVEKVNGNTITTIEGNAGARVMRKTYPWDHWQIKGYARPKYPKASGKKSVVQVAKEVMAKAWGNGTDRVRHLTQAGYDVNAVQKEVNRLVAAGDTKRKSNAEIAKEVLAKKWGNGTDRIRRLTQAGYDANAVQKEVNKLVVARNVTLKSNEAIAKEVIQGKWGNGKSREKRLTDAGYNYGAVQKIVNRMV